jgi:hypothetical protein
MKIIFLLILLIAFLYFNAPVESFTDVECEKKKTCPDCPVCEECPGYMQVPQKCPECPKLEKPDEKKICKKYIDKLEEKKWDLPTWSYIDPKEIYKGHQKPPVCAMDTDSKGNIIVRSEPDAVLAQTSFTNYLEAHNNTNVGDYLPAKKLIRDNNWYRKYDECYNEKVKDHIKNQKSEIKSNGDDKWENPEDQKYEFLLPKNRKNKERKSRIISQMTNKKE